MKVSFIGPGTQGEDHEAQRPRDPPHARGVQVPGRAVRCRATSCRHACREDVPVPEPPADAGRDIPDRLPPEKLQGGCVLPDRCALVAHRRHRLPRRGGGDRLTGR